MKYKLFLLGLLISLSTYAQIEPDSVLIEGTIEQDDPSVTDCFIEMPEFPGGLSALDLFIQHNFRTLDSSVLTGKVVVQFTVDRLGFLREIEIIKPLSPYYDKEVIRVFGSMPKWTPGGSSSSKKSMRMTYPVNFKKGKVILLSRKRK